MHSNLLDSHLLYITEFRAVSGTQIASPVQPRWALHLEVTASLYLSVVTPLQTGLQVAIFVTIQHNYSCENNITLSD